MTRMTNNGSNEPDPDLSGHAEGCSDASSVEFNGQNGESLRPFERSLPMELLKARETVMERFRPILRTNGLTEQQWRVLRALSGVEMTSLSELAAAIHLRLPSLSRIVPGLVARGLITRTTKESDQRTSLIKLAREGRRILERVGPQSEKQYRALEASLGRDRIESLYDLLRLVRELG